MDDAGHIEPPAQLLSELRKLDIGKLFEDGEFRSACEADLAEAGCRPPLNKLVVSLLGAGVSTCGSLMGDGLRGKLIKLAETTPGVSALFRRLITLAGKLHDKTELKTELIKALRGEAFKLNTAVDYSKDLDHIQFLYGAKRLDEISDQIAGQFDDLRADLSAILGDVHEPRLYNPRATAGGKDGIIEGLRFTREVDSFREREDELDFLHRFLGDPTNTPPFRWQLITGDGGEGKSRLALQFLGAATERLFRSGFIRADELKRCDPERWRPRWATLIVIDYPAQRPDNVRSLLEGLAVNADEFQFPVRVLLLERDARGEWFKTLQPENHLGDRIRGAAFREPYALPPLTKGALISLMRARLPAALAERFDDQALFGAAARIDNRVISVADGDRQVQFQWPRALFAAATAAAVSEQWADLNQPVAVMLEALDREAVLSRLIVREREQFWKDGAPPDLLIEKSRLEVHENALLLATFCLGLDRALLEDGWPADTANILPNSDTVDVIRRFDPERYRRMAGGEPELALGGLEPDLLGEFFVLDKLASKPIAERQKLIDAAYHLGGDDAAQFVVRAAIDFPERWRGLNQLAPSAAHGLDSALPFSRAQVDLIATAGEKISLDDAKTVLYQVKSLAIQTDDSTLFMEAAKAATNYIGKADPHDSRRELDWLKYLAAKHDSLALRRAAAMATTNYIGKANPQDSHPELDWIKGLAAKYDDPTLRLEAAKAVTNYINEADPQTSRPELNWLKELSSRYDDPSIELQAAQAVTNYAATAATQDSQPELDWLKHLADTHNNPTLHLEAAKGVTNYIGRASAQDGRRELDCLKILVAEHGNAALRLSAAVAATNFVAIASPQDSLPDLEWIKGLTAKHDDAALRFQASQAVINYTGTAAPQDSRPQLDWLKGLAAKDENPALLAESAVAVTNYIGRAAPRDSITEFAWIKNLVNLTDDPKIRLEAARSATNFINNSAPKDGKEKLEWLKEFAASYNEPGVRFEAAKAAFNLFVTVFQTEGQQQASRELSELVDFLNRYAEDVGLSPVRARVRDFLRQRGWQALDSIGIE